MFRQLSILLFITLILPPDIAIAQTEKKDGNASTIELIKWSRSKETLKSSIMMEPAGQLHVLARGGEKSFMVELGELIFRSPLTLGGNARRLGLSCNSCHTSGAVNTAFFIPVLSDQPGNIDVSHHLWNSLDDDSLDNPINIPSLRGIRWTAPYGRDGRTQSLLEFSRNVIVGEFGGRALHPLLLDALVAYQREFAFLPNNIFDSTGKLTTSASVEKKRGEILFQRDCINCHIPTSVYTDGRSHDVGTNGYFDTPTLLGLSETSPYFHDGRSPDLLSVVKHFERVLDLNYGPIQRADLTSFLEALGAVDILPMPINLARDMTQITEFAALLEIPISDENFLLVERISDMLRFELKRIYERFPKTIHKAQRAILTTLSIDLQDIVDDARVGKYGRASQRLVSWRQRSVAAVEILEAAVSTSLYDPNMTKAINSGTN